MNLNVVSVRNIHQVDQNGVEVIEQVDQLRRLSVDNGVNAHKVSILKTTNFAQLSTQLEFSEGAHINVARRPGAVRVGVPSTEEGVAIIGEQCVEVVRCVSNGNAPFSLVGRSVGASIPSVVEGRLVPKGLLPDHFWPHALASKVGQVAVGVDIPQSLGIAIVASISHKDTRAVVVGGVDVVITGRFVVATRYLVGVTNPIRIHVGRAISIANAEGVELTYTVIHIIADAILVCVGRAIPIANAKGVFGSYAIVDIITDAVAVRIGGAITATDVQCVQLVAIAITVARGNARTVTDAAFIHGAHTVVCVITDSVVVGIGGAGATTDVQCVELVAIAITVSFGNARSVTDAAFIEGSHAGVHIVANAIAVGISGAAATTNTQCVELIAIAVTIASRNAAATAFAALVELVAIAIAVSSGDVSASALVDVSRTAADSTGVFSQARPVICCCRRVVVAS